MCFSTINVEEIAKEKVLFWRMTTKREEPSIPDLAIMISDVPKKWQELVATRIIELTAR